MSATPSEHSNLSGSATNVGGSYFFGWDLLYKTIEKSINKKADVLIALVHFVLIRHSNFRCIGLGEDKTISEDEAGSEILPDGWNDDDERYALRYVHDGKLYLLLGHKTETVLIINLLDVKSKKVSNIGIDPEEEVKETKGGITQLIPQSSVLVNRFRKELLDPVFGGVAREVTTQTNPPPQQRRDPLRVTDPMRPTGQFAPPGYTPRPFGFPEVGRGDLDPLGRAGPGNLFPFPSRPDFPNVGGPVQPRFDPYGPPDFNLRPNPNPDHMQPPSFGGDHYYM